MVQLARAILKNTASEKLATVMWHRVDIYEDVRKTVEKL